MTADDTPQLSHLATIAVKVATPIELGQTAQGRRRIIPILGGTVSGPELRGKVLAGGADFQLLTSDTVTELEAKYAIRTEEGDHLYVDNFGIRTGSADDIAALVRGERVDPSRVYFRCSPRISASGEKWGWLGTRILVGVGERLPDEVRLKVYVVD